MANYCANMVAFEGELSALLRLRTMFTGAQRDKAFRPEILPEAEDSSYFFDITMDGNKLYYETRWVPNLQGVLRLAETLGLDYCHQYDEMQTYVFGEAWRQGGEFGHVWLEPGEMNSHDEDEWETLLADKKKVLLETPAIFRTTGNISTAELEELYGPLLTGDLFMKLAGHKNFDGAQKLFGRWDKETVCLMEQFLDSET